jgi:hypothetical protein
MEPFKVEAGFHEVISGCGLKRKLDDWMVEELQAATGIVIDSTESHFLDLKINYILGI